MALGGAMALLQSACSPALLAPDAFAGPEARKAALAACCTGTTNSIPADLVVSLEQHSADLPQLLRATKLRPAYLETQSDAHAALLSRMKPMDVIVNRNGSRLAGGHGFAYFGHAALYLGTEAQLRAIGAWDHPALVPHHEAIRAGAVAIEATERGVHLSKPPEVFEADTSVVLRPKDCACACNGVIQAAKLIGRGFDYHLAVEDGDPELICTEVVDLALPGLRLLTRDVAGHRVILPDEIVAHALAGTVPLEFVMAIEGYPKGWRLRTEDEVAAMVLGPYQ